MPDIVTPFLSTAQNLFGDNHIKLKGDLKESPFVVRHAHSFQSILTSASKVYRWQFDEALRNSPEDARSMRLDGWLIAMLRERQRPVARAKWHLEPEDEKDQRQVQAAALVTTLIKRIPMFGQFRMSLRECDWYGRSANQLAIGREKVRGIPRWGVKAWVPVHGDKLVFRQDGTPCLMIWAQDRSKYEAQGYNVEATERGYCLYLDNQSLRERFVIDRFEIQDADWYDPQAAGQIAGLGLRHHLQWLWWLRAETQSWILDTMARVGAGGLTIIRYEEGNPKSEAKAERVAKDLETGNVITVPSPKGTSKDTNQIERIEPNIVGVQFLSDLVDSMFESKMERLVVGQTASSSSKSSGMGTHNTDFQQDCVPVDSEILTREGFKSPYAVEVGEEVLAFDADTNTSRWTPLLRKTFYNDRPVSRFHSGDRGWFEAICTSDHSWAVEGQGFLDRRCPTPPADRLEVGSKGGLRLKDTPRSLKKANQVGKADRLIIAAPEVETTDSILTPTEAAILGWAVTDGHIRWIRHGYRVSICQSKPENLEELRTLTAEFGAREWSGEPTIRTFPAGNTSTCLPQHWWVLPQEAGTDLLDKCGYKSKADLPGIVTRLSPPARRAMLAAMMKAEADANRVFANKNSYLIEAFEILCALEGHATGRLRKKSVVWVKSIRLRRHASGLNMKLEPAGNSDIWCPTTKYGTWVMRQNGRVTITGNTKFQLIAGDAEDLSETLTTDLVAPLLRWNCPGADFRLRFVTDLREPDNKPKLDAVKAVFDMGGDVPEKYALQLAGVPPIQPGDKVLSNQQQMIPGMPGMGGLPGGPGAPNAGNGPAGGASGAAAGGVAAGAPLDGGAVEGSDDEPGGQVDQPADGGDVDGVHAADSTDPADDESSPDIQGYFQNAVDSGDLFTPEGLKRLSQELEGGSWKAGQKVQYARAQWTAYRNPEDGRSGWKSAGGRVVYEDPTHGPEEHPHGRKGGGEDEGDSGQGVGQGQGESANKPAASGPGERVRRHVGVERGRAGDLPAIQKQLGEMLDDPASVTPNRMRGVVSALMGLTVPELNQLRQQYGGKRGRKQEMVAGLGKRLQDEGLPAPAEPRARVDIDATEAVNGTPPAQAVAPAAAPQAQNPQATEGKPPVLRPINNETREAHTARIKSQSPHLEAVTAQRIADMQWRMHEQFQKRAGLRNPPPTAPKADFTPVGTPRDILPHQPMKHPDEYGNPFADEGASRGPDPVRPASPAVPSPAAGGSAGLAPTRPSTPPSLPTPAGPAKAPGSVLERIRARQKALAAPPAKTAAPVAPRAAKPAGLTPEPNRTTAPTSKGTADEKVERLMQSLAAPEAGGGVSERDRRIMDAKDSGLSFGKIAKDPALNPEGVSRQRLAQRIAAARELIGKPASAEADIESEKLENMLDMMRAVNPDAIQAEMPRIMASHDKDAVAKHTSRHHKEVAAAESTMDEIMNAYVREAESGTLTPEKRAEFERRFAQPNAIVSRSFKKAP